MCNQPWECALVNPSKKKQKTGNTRESVSADLIHDWAD